MNNLAYTAPLELKGDDENDASATVVDALAKLEKSVGDRLAAVETKSADAAKLADRLDKLEAKGNRLPASNDNAANDNSNEIERKAFASFLRSGQVPGGEIERKTLTVAADAPGYVLAPVDTQREFLRNLVEFSPVRGRSDARQRQHRTRSVRSVAGVASMRSTGPAPTRPLSSAPARGWPSP